MDGTEGDFNGFGPGFDGFPKRLPEDCVEYSLFVIDSTLRTQKEKLARLEVIRKAALKLTGRLLKKYIWQRESFDLQVRSEKSLVYLHGQTNFGDSAEDEWLIVYLLVELSREYSDLWIKAVDTDGEFLLIEAANTLPRWLNPEIADNRVWIHNGTLRIIPLGATSPSESADRNNSRSLSLDEALKTLNSAPKLLIHSPMVEEEAFYRLRNYPSQIEASLHHAIVRIPRRLAYILHTLPASIAPAVEAFYLRDPIALKSVESNHNGKAFPVNDLVTISVRFTRVLFAQLKSQQFMPPSAWKDILSKADTSAKLHSQLDMGMKVTSGFEMLISDEKNADHRKVREIKIMLDDLVVEENSILPSDAEITSWHEIDREDDEKWLDINFEDFERELDGKNKTKENSKRPGLFGPEPPPGFGDAKTQADLKKMVERFEAFLNDDEAGVDGAEIDDMDVDDDDDDDDDDEDDESEQDSEDEDKDVSFDEKEFARMMREMMGLPPDEHSKAGSNPRDKVPQVDKDKEIKSVTSDEAEDSEDEVNDIKQITERMEAELKDAGALNLESIHNRALTSDGKQVGQDDKPGDGSESESDGEVNIDFNLAKNLLESFKSQAGMAGPGSNLLGLMGMQLPRDEDEIASTGKKR